ncbi:GH92 family glycosyl hydrolase [Hephaestia mangrovi]|uniref:GH92 family glycosyl hydrolase n=1 Tax=Hephaestia mangrovi TaxID=2873268 RepID=UPI001CA7B4DE|nr:GH92 family glycosyl hydrolase [Hephaestia mangrovi]MBY8828019.1 GH92 family glycosyl hydrolase [Hephaestia mangrovi]
MRIARGFALLPVLALLGAAPAPGDAVAEVDPFIGVDWGGGAFVGAAVPFGMVKLGPDMESFDGVPTKFGYRSAGRILGFSHTHLSGAAGKYGNIRVMPASGPLDMTDLASPRSAESDAPGYYTSKLTRPDVRAELTADARAGVHRYTFLSARPAHLTVRIDQMLSKSPGPEDQRFLGGSVHLASRHEIDGMGRYAGGWNMGGEYRVYFALVTDRDASGVRSWTGGAPSAGKDVTVSGDHPLGAVLDFGAHAGQTVTARVGLSFVSIHQARHNALAAAGFDATRAAATARWRRALAPITVDGGTPAQRRELYTALYHVMLLPTDRTGENPNWQSGEPYYDDYYTLWDTFRSQWPLLTLIAPDRSRDMVRSLIDIYRHDGWLPDGRSGNINGRTQGGSNADVVIADAFVKGLRGIDYRTALQAVLKDATVSPENPQKEGRGGLPDYLGKGYISTRYERAGSRTVEYAYDDYAIAELACGLGRDDLARAFAKRAGNWANLWDRSLSVEGVSGFLRPRNPDGSWAAPYLVERGTWPDFMYEADIWTYSLYAPQDVARLIGLSGGKAGFIKRLDTLFDHGHFDMGNEPGFLIPMLYHWAGRPDLSVDRIIAYRERDFTDRRAGIPGNDDAGAMSSWLIFQMLGFYPVAGQDVYLIGSPVFPRSTIDLGEGKRLTILAEGLGSDTTARYVQSAELNGKPLDRAWFRQSEIADGGTLRLHMGSAPSTWGTATPPPSLSDGAQFDHCPSADG